MKKMKYGNPTGGLIVLAGFFAALLLQAPLALNINIASAADMTEQDVSKQGLIAKEGEAQAAMQGGSSKDDPCIKNKNISHGCMIMDGSGHSSDGATCTSGVACASEGSNCAFGGTRHCTTHDLGGGNCTCACMQ